MSEPTPEAESTPVQSQSSHDGDSSQSDGPQQADGTPDGSTAVPDGADFGGAPDDATQAGGFADVVELIDPAAERIAALEQEVRDLQARLRAVSAAYQDQQKDMESVRGRLERQAAIKEEMRKGQVVGQLFEPVQNLKRSVEAARKGASMEDTVSGLSLVMNEFMEALHKLGLEAVPGKGAPFDPNVHEALSMIPVTDPALDNVVLDVFSDGYRIGSRLVAPARVVIGQLQEPVGEA